MMGTIGQFKKICLPQLVSLNSSLELSFLWPVSWKQALCRGFQIFLLQHATTCSFANGMHGCLLQNCENQKFLHVGFCGRIDTKGSNI